MRGRVRYQGSRPCYRRPA